MTELVYIEEEAISCNCFGQIVRRIMYYSKNITINFYIYLNFNDSVKNCFLFIYFKF